MYFSNISSTTHKLFCKMNFENNKTYSVTTYGPLSTLSFLKIVWRSFSVPFNFLSWIWPCLSQASFGQSVSSSAMLCFVGKHVSTNDVIVETIDLYGRGGERVVISSAEAAILLVVASGDENVALQSFF